MSICRFKKLETLSKELLYQRAVAKKYNPANTTFKGGKGGDARTSFLFECMQGDAHKTRLPSIWLLTYVT